MIKDFQSMLEDAFNIFNEIYFDGELPPIVITIMSSPRSNGHFTCGKVWRSEDERMHEINISAEHLNRPIENICATLIHEMVHYYCSLNGIQDVSQGGRYHNKNFKREAEKRGLIISQGQYIGWSITNPSDELIEVIRENGIEKPIDINRDGEASFFMGIGKIGVDGKGSDGQIQTMPKKKSSTRKYICPSCGNSLRATKDLNIMCMDCMEQFVKVEK